MRAWRRGTKEMDLILGGYADRNLETLGADELALLEDLMEENDQDLYAWISGQTAPPERFRALIGALADIPARS